MCLAGSIKNISGPISSFMLKLGRADANQLNSKQLVFEYSN